MTQPGASRVWRRATRSPQPAAVRNRASSTRPCAERERSGPAVPLQCARYRYMAFLGVVKIGIVATALIRRGVQ
jgi:hypothetical protein